MGMSDESPSLLSLSNKTRIVVAFYRYPNTRSSASNLEEGVSDPLRNLMFVRNLITMIEGHSAALIQTPIASAVVDNI